MVDQVLTAPLRTVVFWIPSTSVNLLDVLHVDLVAFGVQGVAGEA